MTGSRALAHWEGEPVEHWRSRWRLPALLVFESTPSTNDIVREAGRAGAAAGTTAIAEHQSRGRGRLGRSWDAPPGSALLLSVLLRPAMGGSPSAAAALPLRVGLAIAEALHALTGLEAGLKWPNDVQLGDRKVAGVLCEAAAEAVVVGLGVNVAQTEADLDPEIRDRATSLRIVTGRTTSRTDLAGAILERLVPLFTAPPEPLSAAEIERFTARDVLAGRPILVDDAPAGVALGVTAFGSLLALAGGERRLIHAGTVRSVP